MMRPTVLNERRKAVGKRVNHSLVITVAHVMLVFVKKNEGETVLLDLGAVMVTVTLVPEAVAAVTVGE
jgi:hypothetical protein